MFKKEIFTAFFLTSSHYHNITPENNSFPSFVCMTTGSYSRISAASLYNHIYSVYIAYI